MAPGEAIELLSAHGLGRDSAKGLFRTWQALSQFGAWFQAQLFQVNAATS